MVVDGVEDFLAVVRLLRQLELDQRRHVDVHHLELLLEPVGDFLAAAASWSRENNAFHFIKKIDIS